MGWVEVLVCMGVVGIKLGVEKKKKKRKKINRFSFFIRYFNGKGKK